MVDARLSALDASFLEVESATAHMHVGWAAVFEPPAHGPRPSFEELRDHIASRLGRAPRYRQKLARVPLGVSEPAWVDDPNFDIDRHLLRSRSGDLDEIVDAVMSVPLERERPLWEMWLADELDDGTIGLVGKAHHCMVDGIAAVELATLLLDTEPVPPEVEGEGWSPRPMPGGVELLIDGLAHRVGQATRLATAPLGLLRRPGRLFALPDKGAQMIRTMARTAFPLAPDSALNRPSSPLRHLASLRRPLDDLRTIKERTGTTVNDVVLAACAGGLCGYLSERGDDPVSLKTMVPVNVRGDDDAGNLGNRISFMFVELPCDDLDPLRRLASVHQATSLRKAEGDPHGTDRTLQALAYAPSSVQKVVSHLVSSSRTFNLVISNIPGPRVPLYMRSCELLESYPVVPLAQDHALSIGMTTVRDDACFGFYVDRKVLPDADELPAHVDAAIDELLELTDRSPAPPPELEAEAEAEREREPEPPELTPV
ncbi:MAG TPA: wax ester/triacylglycerol synthase family O-acyltransferase [Solirubrobacteraceae bacterium]